MDRRDVLDRIFDEFGHDRFLQSLTMFMSDYECSSFAEVCGFSEDSEEDVCDSEEE